jgi:hypothetical protein
VEHYYEGKPLDSMALERGCSKVAVWKRLEKAKEKLRTALFGAGLSVLALAMESRLEALVFTPAPKDLIGGTILAQASIVAGAGSPSSPFAVGAIAMKSKLLAGALLFSLLLGSGAFLWRSSDRFARRFESLARTPSSPKKANEQALAPRRSSGVARPADSSATKDPSDRQGAAQFATFEAFRKALEKALEIPDQSERWKALREIGIRLSDQDFREVELREAAQRGRIRRHLIELICYQWAERDPAAVLNLLTHFSDVILNFPPGSMFIGQFGAIAIRRWGQTDPEAAAAFIQQLPKGRFRTECLDYLGAASSPAGFAASLLEMASGKKRESHYELLASIWAEKDPAEALRWMEGLPPGNDRTAAGLGFAKARGKSDIRAVLQWIETLPAGTAGSRVLAEAVKTWAEAQSKPDPAQAKALCGRLPEDLRWETLNYITGTWIAHVDSVGALPLLFELPEKMRDIGGFLGSEYSPRELLAAWARTDAPAAIAYARSLPSGTISDQDLTHLVSLWSQSDPSAAVTYSRSLPPGMVSELEIFKMSAAPADPGAARALALKIEDPRVRDQALAYVVSGLEDNVELDRILQFARDIADPEARRVALHVLAEGRSERNPQASLKILESLPDVTADELVHLAVGWADKDPEEVFRWIQTLRYPDGVPGFEGPERIDDSALKTLLRGWVCERVSQSNAQKALDMIEGLPLAERPEILNRVLPSAGTSMFDAGYSSSKAAALAGPSIGPRGAEVIAQKWANEDPEALLVWTRGLTDPTARDVALLCSVEGISASDPRRAFLLVDGISAPFQRDALEVILASADRAPETALDALRRIRDPIYSDYLGLAQSWARKDPQATLAWIQTLAESVRDRDPNHRESLPAVVMRMTADPTILEQPGFNKQVNPVQQVSLREDLLGIVVTQWAAVDREESANWVRRSALPDGEKTRLMGDIGGRR